VQELFDHPSNSFVDEIRVCSSVYVRLVEMSFSSFIPFIETLVDEKKRIALEHNPPEEKTLSSFAFNL